VTKFGVKRTTLFTKKEMKTNNKEILNVPFLKSEDGHHYYQRRENDWLHVVIYRESGVTTTYTEDGYWESEHKAGESLINSIYMLNPDKEYFVSDEEEFSQAIREAVLNLGIYKYTVPIKNYEEQAKGCSL